MSDSRDRDPLGRPRNARPRDALGRPLPRDSAASDSAASDSATRAARATEPIPERLGPYDAVRLADRLLREGRPFHAHEALEAAWKTAPAAERDLWQGLAQIAVGITHARRGNARGAVTLLRRGIERTARYRGDTYGIDLAAVIRAAGELATQIERDGLEAADTTAGTVTLVSRTTG